jgi:hypothetical protein
MGERAFKTGPGFVSAEPCPHCLHTKCGEDCGCNCGAVRAEARVAELEQVNASLQSRLEMLQAAARQVNAEHRSLLSAEELAQFDEDNRDLEAQGERAVSVAEYLKCRLDDAVAETNKLDDEITAVRGQLRAGEVAKEQAQAREALVVRLADAVLAYLRASYPRKKNADEFEAMREALAALTLPRKTREDVERLKASWIGDPCYDLEEAEGFEAYRWELKAFRLQYENSNLSRARSVEREALQALKRALENV